MGLYALRAAKLQPGYRLPGRWPPSGHIWCYYKLAMLFLNIVCLTVAASCTDLLLNDEWTLDTTQTVGDKPTEANQTKCQRHFRLRRRVHPIDNRWNFRESMATPCHTPMMEGIAHQRTKMRANGRRTRITRGISKS
jgi:hypothetical protein